MATVNANVWYWTPRGMSETMPLVGSKVGYVELRETERLLEEAHERGRVQGLKQAEDVIRSASL